MTAWISGLSLALLASVAAITAFLGWRRSTLFRESFPSLSIELNQEHIWADPEWTLLVLTAKLKNTSHVLVEVESVEWILRMFVPGQSDTVELEVSPKPVLPFPDVYLEPQAEDVIIAEIWTPTPETPRPAFAQLVIHCALGKTGGRHEWGRRIYFVLEEYHA